MTEEELQLLRDIIHQIGDGGSYIISQYANWYFVNAIVWLGVGLLLLGLSICVYRKVEDDFYIFLSLVLGIVSLVFIGANITNIIASEPYAIYALIDHIKK